MDDTDAACHLQPDAGTSCEAAACLQWVMVRPCHRDHNVHRSGARGSGVIYHMFSWHMFMVCDVTENQNGT